MKFLILTLILTSQVTMAEVTKSSSENVNNNFLISATEVINIGAKAMDLSQENILRYSCLASDNVEAMCVYEAKVDASTCDSEVMEYTVEIVPSFQKTEASLVSNSDLCVE